MPYRGCAYLNILKVEKIVKVCFPTMGRTYESLGNMEVIR